MGYFENAQFNKNLNKTKKQSDHEAKNSRNASILKQINRIFPFLTSCFCLSFYANFKYILQY